MHSNKYYHLVKALRMQKQQSERSRAFRQESLVRKSDHQNFNLTSEHIAEIIDLDNSAEMDEKDQKFAIRFNENEKEQGEYSRLWRKFEQESLIFKLPDDAMHIHRKISQAKDEKNIDAILEDCQAERERRELKIMQLNNDMKEEEEELTELKEVAIALGVELEGYDKEFVDLKANFDKEQKKINERSSKYKEEKSKDIMIKNIDREDMEMRKAMASRIKLNQELDFGFQIQRRRAFNQAKASITERKKKCQEKVNKLNAVIAQHQANEDKIVALKADLQKKNEQAEKETIYFVKKIMKRFKNHSRGIQWLIKHLQDWNVTIQREDFPDQLSKEDTNFISALLHEIRPTEFDSRLRNFNLNSYTPRSNAKSKYNHRFQTEPNQLNNDQKRNKTCQEKKKLQQKATVYFDIQNQNQTSFYASERSKNEKTSFNINTKSLKKIYEHAGQVISNMIKNHSLNYNSCKAMSFSAFSEPELPNQLQRKAIEDKIKAKFMNIRQRERRNNLKKLLFGQN